MRRLFLITSSALLLVACANIKPPPPPPSDDISVEGAIDQKLILDGITTLVVRCYCPLRQITQEPMEGTANLHVVGKLQSIGYHGPQPHPKEALEQWLLFAERREGDLLILEAKERSFMHHTFGISSIHITAPSDRKIHIEPLSAADIYNRRNSE